MTFAEQILSFLTQLDFRVTLPRGIEVMQPFETKETFSACTAFYQKFYGDNKQRQLIMGINPGRFGGGVTGIPFTDPLRLAQHCGINNDWPQRQELSSVFVYDMIAAYGGPEAFYDRFYISAISPLGFTSQGKNLNYYDDKVLQERVRPFVITSLRQQLEFGPSVGGSAVVAPLAYPLSVTTPPVELAVSHSAADAGRPPSWATLTSLIPACAEKSSGHAPETTSRLEYVSESARIHPSCMENRASTQ